ncbi:D-alanyl-D-alanine carboxypeptidase/D-alanyl-D-alanine endopeptidase [Streptomyces gilvosporeus]|uniref:D-alanyl-D-alanine carboxypeptidase/D-alanyl-D-alanine-endopeptidase n=1 Tax=Streptomyces gilvosporeus TaxID=553510 RepID=A0A1V0U1T7_9ACTN|nr:D-alanyl-D-alanine carboxypeptidase/D-alanyl-D-alanine-endopeptidase [Streptomyces gilvosporeus]ARF59184.1 D-alanyl-D-alanine carboxypeptidase/D-alanyl-D-alanine-endopeptidase [Streptomyces gilvosporeus]
MPHRGRRRLGRRRVLGGLGLVLTVGAVVAGLVQATPSPSPSPSPHRLDPRIASIMRKPTYGHAQWGLFQQNPDSGEVVQSRYPDQFFIPGSSAKLFSVSGTWHSLGSDYRFVTPVHAVGRRSGPTLNGDLDLVAQGDLTLGGRTRKDGTVAFTNVDHTYANDLPGATLTPQDPLAGIDQLARQVRDAGITRVEGDVVVDARLFRPDPVLRPTPTPLIINDNLIDLLTSPGAGPGAPARLEWRPKVAPYRVTSTVRTVASGSPANIHVNSSPDGTRIRLSGTIAAGSAPALRVAPVKDPNAFGRTALIEALKRAGVEVRAAATGPNPDYRLPASYRSAPAVARYSSPTYAQYAELIFKVSHNLGANLGICLMATRTGSSDCEDGFPVLAQFLDDAKVDRKAVQLADGRGGNPVDRTTPQALAQMLTYWQHTSQAERFRRSLPILGVDGTLAGACRDCPSRGKVFAKTGTVAGGDALNDRLAVGAETAAGYLETRKGHFDVFFVGVNGASTSGADVTGVLDMGNDVADIAARLQQDAAGRG